MKKKLLILCQNQWGYHVDTYKYGTYLKNNYNITYLCWDYGKKIIKNENINVKYISRNGSLLSRNLRYFYESINEINKLSPDICFIKYFRGCSILKVVKYKNIFIFDIRTGSVKNNIFYRIIYDNFMLLESKIFKNVTVISKSLKNKMKLGKNVYILPLGSDIISKNIKNFNNLKLVYVGTLDDRNIVKTIEGFAIFLKKYKPNKKIIYTIVGDGKNINKLKNAVINYGLEKNINIIGQVPFNELEPIMDSHNIGVSFVPCTSYFDCQPVTKTFDYLLSGMPVIATNTSENKKVINYLNGICISDSSESFADGINKIYQNMDSYDSEKIRNNAKKYNWKYIINDFNKYMDYCLLINKNKVT